MEPGGFGEILGNDVSKLQVAVKPIKNVLDVVRARGDMLIIHTREGHRFDMRDVHAHKNSKKDENGIIKKSIGEPGPMGRILLRGEPGHDIIQELYPLPGEPIVDKPGKVNSFSDLCDCVCPKINCSFSKL